MGEVIIFDGHRLNDRFFVGEVDVGLPEYRVESEARPSGRGERLTSMGLGSVTISIQLVAKPVRGERPRAALSELLSWLDVDGERPLSLSSDGGLWRKAVPSGAPVVGDTRWNDRVTVELVQPDPILYGREQSVIVPSGGSAALMVGGDHPTRPTIEASATRDGSTRLWGLRLDEGDYVRVALPQASQAGITIDCDARTCMVGSTLVLPTLDSDWLGLTPGPHVLRMDQGSGSAKVRWIERWHR